MSQVASAESSTKRSYTAALEAVQAQREHLQKGGMSKSHFFLGVANLVLSTFIVGKWPQHYWLWHTFKSVVLLGMKTKYCFQEKLQFQLLDFCWVANFVVCGLWLFILVNLLTGKTLIVSEEAKMQFWLIFFVISNGPLGWAVLAVGNALVFHSWESTAGLFIHWSPMIVSWCLRWNAEAFDASYPGLLTIPAVCSFGHLFIPAVVVYFLWWVPYTVWLLTDGLTRPARGYITVYSYWDDKLSKMVGLNKGRTLALLYMIIHAVCVCATMLSAVLAYNYFAYHSIFVIAMMSSAVWNGARRYDYYLLNAYEKSVIKAAKPLLQEQ